MKNNFQYKWSKLFASKRFNTKDGVIKLDALEQQELLDDAGHDLLNNKEVCCEAFDKIKNEFSWFSHIDDNREKVFCMPNIDSINGKTRVNYCPSCGKEVRNLELKEI